MDVQLQELIDKIKKDGVAAAEKDAAKIIANSEKKAEAIIADAQSKAAEIIKSAQSETKKMEKASEEAIVQAGRNMLLSFKDALIGELDGLIQTGTEKALSKDVLGKLVPETVKAWAKNSDGILTFSFHWYSPIGGRDKSFYTEHTDFDASRILEKNSPEREAFFHDMDEMAEHLKPFLEEDIPILWRPFHESDGTWFWWGAIPGPAGVVPCGAFSSRRRPPSAPPRCAGIPGTHPQNPQNPQ